MVQGYVVPSSPEAELDSARLCGQHSRMVSSSPAAAIGQGTPVSGMFTKGEEKQH